MAQCSKTSAAACTLCTHSRYSCGQQEWTVSEMGNRRNLLITGCCSNIKWFLPFLEHRCCRLIAVILHLSIITGRILIVCNSLSKSITVKSCYWSASLETTLIPVPMPFTHYLSCKAQVHSFGWWEHPSLAQGELPCKINATRGRWFPM